ncbi:MAG: endonuclease/exonuclease/phosphatase family protein [Campylobacterota bacterium]|nr:endonuclease/exonuclease/phosphatase family protein [Campylobacterota bacterium]
MLNKIYIIFFAFILSIDAKDFTVASYNVENLFDLKYDGTEYDDYKPYSKYWDKSSYKNKLKNISQVINDLNADILTLQEVESKEAFTTLLKYVPQYKYHFFLKNKTSSVGVAIASIYPISKNERIIVDKNDLYSRDILKSTIIIENKPLIVYNNHWRSKRAKESQRIIYATSLKSDLDNLDKDTDYIITGDLNSNYNEYQTFKYDKKLNNTYGITGINQILNTTIEQNFVIKNKIFEYNKKVHYNLWLEIDKKNRFSSKFRGENNTPDNLLISNSLFDNQNISYIDNSFKVFKTNYLYKKNKIIRWNRYKKSGYSDHLPIIAKFSTKLQKYNFKYLLNNNVNRFNNSISSLYDIQQTDNYKLHNVTVIYKSDKIAIIKKENDRAIMIYKPHKNLKVSYGYDIVVTSIDEYNGLKEIKNISYIKKISKNSNYKRLYKDARSIDIFDLKYQNEVVKNLRGTYKKGYLYYRHNSKDMKVRLYFSGKLKRPQDGKIVTITQGHLGIYKSKIQIILYSKNDFN